jgi:hypothetical protein
MNTPKFKTVLTAKAKVLAPGSDRFRTVAASIKQKYGFELKPQMDLLYVESCLVTAGAAAGINQNDDIFTVADTWAARFSPVLKPLNWQHTEKDIVGVMYTVQARDLEGNVLDIHAETPPDTAFDLWTEAVIFSLVHQKRAAEVLTRANAGNLYVSMEAWFDDYNYGLCDDTGVAKTVARNQNTSFLEGHLKVSGGTGRYVDPDTNQEMRIGRVLRSITFGGCGLVDHPANKRSKIDSAAPMLDLARSEQVKDPIERLLQLALETESSREEILMNAEASNKGGIDPQAIKAAVGSVLDERDQKAAAEAAQTALITRANEAEQKSVTLQKQVTDLTAAKQERDQEVEKLGKQLEAYQAAVDRLVQTEAGATKDTPAEIASIDAAKDGAAAFTAKIAFIEKSRASLVTRAARADELEAQLAEAEKVVREADVRELLGNVVSQEALATFVAHASGLDANEYARWRDEKELMVIEMSAKAAGKPPFPPKKGDKKAAEECKTEEAKATQNLFAALLGKRKAGLASPETMPAYVPHLINPNGGANLNSGVSADQLRTPRHRIAGSAGDANTSLLEHAQAEEGLDLAGASAHADDEGGSVSKAYRSLASLVTGTGKVVNKKKDPAEKPGFDPVQ